MTATHSIQFEDKEPNRPFRPLSQGETEAGLLSTTLWRERGSQSPSLSAGIIRRTFLPEKPSRGYFVHAVGTSQPIKAFLCENRGPKQHTVGELKLPKSLLWRRRLFLGSRGGLAGSKSFALYGIVRKKMRYCALAGLHSKCSNSSSFDHVPNFRAE